jgi:hypothetical protein
LQYAAGVDEPVDDLRRQRLQELEREQDLVRNPHTLLPRQRQRRRLSVLRLAR